MPTWIFKAIQYAIEDIFDISGIPKLQKSSSKELQYTVQEMKIEGFFPTDQIYSERKVGSVLDLFLKFAETSLFSGLDDDLLLQPSWSPPRLLLRGASAKKAKAWGLAVGNYFEAKAESEKPP